MFHSFKEKLHLLIGLIFASIALPGFAASFDANVPVFKPSAGKLLDKAWIGDAKDVYNGGVPGAIALVKVDTALEPDKALATNYSLDKQTIGAAGLNKATGELDKVTGDRSPGLVKIGTDTYAQTSSTLGSIWRLAVTT